ncbi:MAG: DUF4345 family protein [Myxococcales bacterium]|nr:DUF4345 family protein [Myxococcales bacterium]
MKTTAARILLGLPGLFILTTGVVFLLAPEAGAAKLQLVARGSEGLSNLRGMAGAPLFAVGASLILAAITTRLVYARPAAIFLLALIASRVLSYLVDGPTDAIGLFLAVPSITFAMMLIGHKLLVDGSHEVTTVGA